VFGKNPVDLVFFIGTLVFAQAVQPLLHRFRIVNPDFKFNFNRHVRLFVPLLKK
jgi:hypothetical protein